MTRLAVDELGIPEGVRDVVGRRLSRLSGERQPAPADRRGGRAWSSSSPWSRRPGAVDEESSSPPGGSDRRPAGRPRCPGARLPLRPRPGAGHAVRAALRRPPGRRSTARSAEAIETAPRGALDDHLPALAHHWARAGAPVAETARAVDYATRAGDRALAQLAHDEAGRLLPSGLELLGAGGADRTEHRRLELLIGLGEAQRRAGEPASRQTLLDAARPGPPAGRGRRARPSRPGQHPGRLLRLGCSVDTDRVEVLEAAVAAVGRQRPGSRARLLATLGVGAGVAGDPQRGCVD